MMLDAIPSLAEVRRAVAALKVIRGRVTALDRAVDALTPRALAHLAEEALRDCAGGRGLWRLAGLDASLITAAIARLNSCCFRNVPTARTRFQNADGPQVVSGASTRLGATS